MLAVSWEVWLKGLPFGNNPPIHPKGNIASEMIKLSAFNIRLKTSKDKNATFIIIFQVCLVLCSVVGALFHFFLFLLLFSYVLLFLLLFLFFFFVFLPLSSLFFYFFSSSSFSPPSSCSSNFLFFFLLCYSSVFSFSFLFVFCCGRT